MVVSPSEELANQVRGILPGVPVDMVRSSLMALGEIGVGGAPRAVVLGSSEDWAQAAGVVESLRSLAPAARMIAVAGSRDAAALLQAAQLDALLVEPLGADALRVALTGGPLQEPSSSCPPEGQGVPKSDGPPPEDEELGDVDLVEHLVRRQPGFTDLALRVVRARCGLAGAHVVRGPAQPGGTSEVRVPLVFDGRTLGTLCAPAPAKEAQLAPWAGWLARWLAIEAQMSGLWHLAFTDELTGAWNRRYCHRFLEMMIKRAATERFRVTVMVFDIDDFKIYNDRYGHAAGDDILRETARLMRSVVRPHDVVARIGGDEFAVVFWDAQQPRRPHSEHPNDVRKAAERFQKAICAHRFPKLGNQAPGTLTISGGLASFPWDGRTPTELIERADAMLLQSKAQGKNALTFGPGAARGCDQ